MSYIIFPLSITNSYPLVLAQKLLAHGNVVVLESAASGRSLRVHDDGRIDGSGGSGPLGETPLLTNVLHRALCIILDSVNQYF